KLAAANGTAKLSDHQLLEHFASRHDDAAFATLVERHGAMVLGVCRRVLHHLHDAEDVFQATFLILARKAGSIRRYDSIAGWLYQVAYQLAVKARASAAKRRNYPRREVDMPTADPLAELNGQELRSLLDEELNQLPEQCRSALVLCYLEGKTQDEAARLLGWSKGTLRRRLGQGREFLRIRLVRRGLSLSAALIATLLAQAAVKATVRTALANATVKAASGLAAGQTMAGLVSVPVAALVEGGLNTML